MNCLCWTSPKQRFLVDFQQNQLVQLVPPKWCHSLPGCSSPSLANLLGLGLPSPPADSDTAPWQRLRFEMRWTCAVFSWEISSFVVQLYLVSFLDSLAFRISGIFPGSSSCFFEEKQSCACRSRFCPNSQVPEIPRRGPPWANCAGQCAAT